MAHQQITRDWWETRKSAFDLYASEAVIAEAERGNAEAARARLAVLAPLPCLFATDESEELVPILLAETGLPPFAFLDMSHVALAAVHGMQYLLTWNCRHIANARVIRVVNKVCRERRYEPPVICTPEELMES